MRSPSRCCGGCLPRQGRRRLPADGEPAAASKRLGVFTDLDAAVKAAQAAFEALDKLTLAKRDEIIANIRKWSLRESESLAFAAHSETGFGRYEDKIIKNRLVANKTPGTEVLQAEVKTGDGGLSLFERAPFGVIGSITPSHQSHVDDHQQHDLDGGRRQRGGVQRPSVGQRVLDPLRRRHQPGDCRSGRAGEPGRHDGRADDRIGPGADGAPAAFAWWWSPAGRASSRRR